MILTHFQQIWRFRALLSALVVRHLTARYRGSVLGFLWSLLNPLGLMAVYTLVFRFYIRFDGLENYSIFVFAGLLPWIWFTGATSEGTSSIVSSGHLITKSMFPAQILPAVSVISTLINFLLSLPILFIFMLIAGMGFHLSLLLIPVLVALSGLTIYGLVLVLSSINVRYRDVQHILGNILTFLFFLCPIVYPVSSVPERFRFTLDLNPVAVTISAFHSVIMDGAFPSLTTLFYLVIVAAISVCVGVFTFSRLREGFAELL